MVSNYDVIIIGGGIAGLTSAYYLTKKGLNVLLLEKNSELGGLLSSYSFEKFNIEKFYHHVFTSDKDFFNLIDELGLKEQLIWLKASVGQLTHGKIYPLDNIKDILKFPLLSLGDKLRLAFFVLRARHIGDLKGLDRLTAEEWIVANCGKGVYENFFYPLLVAKFGEGYRDISASWLAGRISLRSHRSPTGERLGYMKDGFNVLIDHLAERITKKAKLITGCRVRRIITEGRGVKAVETGNGTFFSNRIISTISPRELLEICNLSREEENRLKNIDFQSVICLLLALNKSVIRNYWLNINSKSLPFHLLIEHTNFYRKPDYKASLIYICSYLNSKEDSLWNRNNEEIKDLYLDGLREIKDIRNEDILWWRLTRAEYAGPLYKTGFLKHKPEYNTHYKGLFITGMVSSYPERSINESIRQGLECAKHLLENT